MIRCESDTLVRFSLIKLRVFLFLKKASVLVNREFILSNFIIGFISQFLNNLPPPAVRVQSIESINVPF